MGRGVQILQHEPDRTVMLEPGGAVVRKVFHSEDPGASRESAEREFGILRRFNDALSDVQSSTCPRPLELGQGDDVYVRMERASGLPMQAHLNRRDWPPGMDHELAAVLREGLVRYVETFDEPYWDFIFRNMFYDAEQRLVTFLDFGFPPLYLPMLDELNRRTPIEVSLAALVTSAIFEAGRPKRMIRRREHRRAFRLASMTVHDVASHPAAGTVSIDAIRESASGLYALAAGGGGRLRREWYLRLGALLARPSSKLRTLRP